MAVHTSRRLLTISLTGLSGLSALATIGALEEFSEVRGQALPHRFDEVLLVWLLMVSVLAAGATVAYSHGRHRATQWILLATGLMGLIPAVLPGVFALVARALVKREG
ncbi:hypothetical protein ACIBMZ_23705 [Micromonospora sp. NPDC049900]|uniref:hypothetical protein n=1 Tax=Micromonospora sp. NPDC049900 TaxID=3364275 RepID=UPI00378DF644